MSDDDIMTRTMMIVLFLSIMMNVSSRPQDDDVGDETNEDGDVGDDDDNDDDDDDNNDNDDDDDGDGAVGFDDGSCLLFSSLLRRI